MQVNRHAPPTISLAATNPCHLWPMAEELYRLGALGEYYSGYPKWKLCPPRGMPVRFHSFRTVVTYALYGNVPERLRPSNRQLFRWQDDGFDRWVSKVLKPANDFHGIPGQCLAGFRRARQLGIRTILNHATGPADQVAKLLKPEYDRLGMKVSDEGGYDSTVLSRNAEEFALADIHCCASSVVRDQLIAAGVENQRIWVVPYGADPRIWHPGSRSRSRKPGDRFKILFAGQLSVRKGLRYLLAALQKAGTTTWQLDVYGSILEETLQDRNAYTGQVPVTYHGAVSQAELAQAMRDSDLLVVPSLEEGFGLVVVQALACGLPCAVSSVVGAKDLIAGEDKGSIFPVKDVDSLLAVLEHWAGTPLRVGGDWGWAGPAGKLIALSKSKTTAPH
jgi:glycosyltransferase involved in cell wall biosynthesis